MAGMALKMELHAQHDTRSEGLEGRRSWSLVGLPRKGRGAVANRLIVSGEVIDHCYTFHMSASDLLVFQQMSIGGYWFSNPGNETEGLIVLGLASLLNHSAHPNAALDWHHDSALGWVAYVNAVMDIFPGEEIVIDYGVGELWV